MTSVRTCVFMLAAIFRLQKIGLALKSSHKLCKSCCDFVRNGKWRCAKKQDEKQVSPDERGRAEQMEKKKKKKKRAEHCKSRNNSFVS